YNIKQIFDHRRNHGKTKYFIKWENYRYKKNIWEPLNHLQNCQEPLRQYY
ncbi:hypothetical protein MGG_18104, partial [Pyricularia oryzae 70-15]